MDELLQLRPQTVDVLARHGVDPRTRSNHAVRNYLKLGSVLGRNCPVDDVEATFNDLEALLREQRASADEHIGRAEDTTSQ